MDRFSVSWLAPEFEHRPKQVGWYWITIIVAIILVAIAIWQRNLLFALFITIAEILFIVWGDREPDEVEVTLDDQGIQIGPRQSYPKNYIEAFSLVRHEHTDWYDLILHLDRQYLPTVLVHVPEYKVPEVRQHLQELYPEYDHEESIVDTLARFFWF